jgi:hypothetical protein
MSDLTENADEELFISDSSNDEKWPSAKSASNTSSTARKMTSDVYAYIKEDDNKGKPFYCFLCHEKNKSHRWRSKNTGNFRYHLQKVHGDLYCSADPQQSKINHFFLKKSGKSESKRKRIGDSVFSEADRKHSDKKLVDWVVNDAQPFSVVEQADFVELVSTLREEYLLPSRNTIKSKVLEQWQKEKKRVCSKLLSDIGGSRCGFTTDMWTSAAKRGYMVITIHYIDDNWEMKSVIIAFVRVLYPHSGERLGDHFIQAVKAMDPKLLCSIWAITTDNASNNGTMLDYINLNLDREIRDCIEEAVAEDAAANSDVGDISCGFTNTSEVFLVSCFAHTIQLAIKDGLANCRNLDAAIGRFRDIVKKISDSPKLLEALAVVCSNLKVANKIPSLDVETRWNSTWEMLNGVISLRKPLEELLRRIRDRHDGFCNFTIEPSSHLAENIPHESWSAVQDFCNFLKPFKEATVLMSGSSYPTLGLAAPVFFTITQHVKKAIGAQTGFKSTHTIKYAKIVQSKLKEYEVKIKSPAVLIAAALDPRVKNLLQKMEIEPADVKKYIVQEYQQHYSERYSSFKARKASTQDSQENSNNNDSLLGSFMGFVDDGDVGKSCEQDDESFENELNRWLSHSPMKANQSSRDVCLWFKVNSANLFPRIGFMAREYLGITSTSVPSECAFSMSGTTISKRRARLGDDAVQAICELQAFLNFR